MFPQPVNNSTVPSLTLFGQHQSSTPFSLPSGSRTIFGSHNSNNNFSNSLIPSSTVPGTSLFPSNNNSSIFSNSPRVGLFTTNSLTPASSSSIFSSNMSYSNIFSSAPKQGSLGFASQSPSGNIFQQTSVYQNSTGPGTPIPFRAVQSSDSVMKGGTQINVQVRLECIPAMKEYENKSLEELRFEDYLAGRKGISNNGFQTQSNTQQGLFSSLSIPSSSKGIFNSTNNNIFQNPQQSPQTSGIFPSKPQTPLSISQISQGNKPISNQSNIFGSIGLTSNAGLFSQQGNSQFPSLPGSIPTNMPNLSNSNLPSNVFSTQPTTNLFTTKSTLPSFIPQSGYSFGQFNPQIGKPNNLQTQMLNSSNSSILSNPQTIQQSGFPNKAFDLNLAKSTSSYLPNNSLIYPNPDAYSSQNLRNSLSGDVVDSPQNIERQLLLLARIPFGDSPLFRNAKQTAEGLGFGIKTFPECDKVENSVDIKKSTPLNIFRVKLQHPDKSDEKFVESSVYFHRNDAPMDNILPNKERILVPRKCSVKKLELSPLQLSDTVTSEFSSIILPLHPTSKGTHTLSSGNQSNTSLGQKTRTDSLSNCYNYPECEFPQSERMTVGDLESALIDDYHIQHTLLTLTRIEYYTSPPCVEIIRHLSPTSQLVVEEFSITRKGFGQIRFPGSTNLTGMDLDQIVFIDEKEVTVYPLGRKKPGDGLGLNKNAIISLMRVWPIDKTSRKPIYDPDKILATRYYEKVEKCTEKLGAHFIDYDIQNGIWTFRVDHFSRYKLIISDSSDGEDCDPDSNEFLFESEGDRDQTISNSVSKRKFVDNVPHDFVYTKNALDVTKLIVPQHNQIPLIRNLFFSPGSSSSTRMGAKSPNQTSVSTIFSRDSIIGKFHQVPNISTHRPKYSLPNRSFFHSISPIIAVDSIINHRTKCVADVSSIWNRSFRPCWGKNCTLVATSPYSYSTSDFIIKIYDCYPSVSGDNSNFLPFLEDLRDIFLDQSEIGAIRSAMVNNLDLYCSFLNSSFYSSVIRILSNKHANIQGFLENIWSLIANVLLPDIGLHSRSYVTSIESVDNLNAWLTRVNSSFGFQNFETLTDKYLSEILLALTKGDINKAADVAMENSDFYLALAISQSIDDKSSKFKIYMRSQLSIWISWPNSEFISPFRVFIYGILSGCFEAISVMPYLEFFLKLNWLQSYFLLLKFSQSPNSPIFDSIITYNRFVSQNCLPHPYPMHYRDLIYSRRSSYDIYYTLLSTAYVKETPLSDLLGVCGYTHFLLDYSYSFQITLTVLASELQRFSRNTLRSHIVMNFAHQLAIFGYWHFAIFILLFLPPSTHMISAINTLIQVECTHNNHFSLEEKFLIDFLSYDTKRLCYYKSNLSNYLKHFDEYFLLLIQSNEASLAHEIILKQFVFPYVINEELTLLKEKLRLVEYQGRINQIINWEMEGSIFLDYIRIFETINKLLDGNSCSGFELEELLLGVRSICIRISNMKFDLLQFEHYLAINEISKNLVLFLKIITSIQKPNSLYTTFSQQTIPYFMNLPLISDNFNMISNEMCDRYLCDVDTL